MSTTIDTSTPTTGLLLDAWLRSLDGIVDKLRSGAMVADVACGHGLATIAMAQAFPRSAFSGYDADAASIRAARDRARASVDGTPSGRNVRFKVADATTFPAYAYDLVTTFEGAGAFDDPAAAARHVRQAIADDGTWMIVEPREAQGLAAIVRDAGFTQVRVVAESPFEIVLEVRP